MNITNKQVLCVGEVLWDNLPTGAKPGGASLNVAVHLKAIGQNVALASRVGDDQLGEKLLAFLQEAGIDTSLIQVDKSLPTSEVLVNLDENNNATYEICEPVAWDNIQLTSSLKEIAKKEGVIVYGSLASRNPTSRETIMKLASLKALKIMDVNLRQPYDRQEVVEALLNMANIVKLNDEELETISRWHGKKQLDEKEVIKWFALNYNLQMVCVTKGEHGASLYKDGKFYEHYGFKVNAVDTVGAGDAFLAGLIHSILNQEPIHEALAFACAIGAFVASKQGAVPKYSLEEVTTLIESSI